MLIQSGPIRWFNRAMLCAGLLLVLLIAPVKGEGIDKNRELMQAVAKGHVQKVRSLLDSGADVNAHTEVGWTALMSAAWRGHMEIAELLLDKGANVNAKDMEGNTALIEAIAARRTRMASLLLNNGADVNARNKLGCTPLIHAVREDSPRMVKLLLDRGADIDAEDDRGMTPLTEVVRGISSAGVLEVLLDNGANVNNSTGTGWIPLMSAVQQQSLKTVILLLNNGAHVNAKTHNGWTALMEASGDYPRPREKTKWYDGIWSTVRRFVWGIEYGPAPPIYLSRDPEIVKVLLQRGADVNAKDNRGVTALRVAEEGGYKEIVELLKSHGAKE